MPHDHVHPDPPPHEQEDPTPTTLVGVCYGSSNPDITDLMVLLLGQLSEGWVVITHTVCANEEVAEDAVEALLESVRSAVPAFSELPYEWIGRKNLDEVVSEYPPAMRGQAALN